MTADFDSSGGTTQAVVEAAWRTERPMLVNLASGILSDGAAAEDVVQEAFDRLTHQDVDQIENVGAWLTVVVRRLAINQLRSASARRERVADPTGADSAGAQIVDPDVDPADRITLDDQVQLALSVMLSRLSPAERTTFVLHDIFGFSFSEVAEIVGRTPQACRQLASRARRSLRSADLEAAIDVDPMASTELTERFIAACTSGDLEALLATLDSDVVGDTKLLGGGQLGHGEGAEHVARRALQFLGPDSVIRTLVPISVDGAPGVLGIAPGQYAIVLRFDLSDGRIRGMHGFVSPREA